MPFHAVTESPLSGHTGFPQSQGAGNPLLVSQGFPEPAAYWCSALAV